MDGMEAALEMARVALDAGELPVGAVIVSGGAVVARAHTRERSESRFLVHAELEALLAFDRARPTMPERRQATLFTTVEPCPMCLGATMSAFVGHVVYALRARSDGAVELLTGWTRSREGFGGYQLPRITAGVGVAEARRLFEAYAARMPDGPMRRWAASLVDDSH